MNAAERGEKTKHPKTFMNRGSIITIQTMVRTGRAGVRFREGGKDFFDLKIFKTNCGAQSAFYSIGKGFCPVGNPLAPNDLNICRTAQLTSRRCVLNIYSTHILTEYFKHAAHSPFFFSLQDAVYFIMLSFLVPVIFTF